MNTLQDILHNELHHMYMKKVYVDSTMDVVKVWTLQVKNTR